MRQVIDLAQSGLSGDVPICRPPGFTTEEIKAELVSDFPILNLPGITLDDIAGAVGFDLDLVSQEITLDALLDTLGVDVGGLVEAQLEELLPFVYTFCDTETYQGECDAGLREILGADDGKSLDEVLDRAREGFTYTEPTSWKT